MCNNRLLITASNRSVFCPRLWTYALSALLFVIAVPSPSVALNPHCPDLTGDGLVNNSDLEALLSFFGLPLNQLPPASTNADLDGDGTVTQEDLDRVLYYYSTECLIPPPPNQPQPCVELNISESKIKSDLLSKTIQKRVSSALKKLSRVARVTIKNNKKEGKRLKKKGKKLKARASRAQAGLYQILNSFPDHITFCPNAPTCSTTDNSGALSAFLTSAKEMTTIGKKATTLAMRAKHSPSKNIRRAKRSFANLAKSAEAIVNAIPAKKSICPII